jgi:ketosteroid isomerase-like protein
MDSEARRGTMSAQENLELVRPGFTAFSPGDMARLNVLFAEDAVWHMAGSGVVSGPKKGRDAILSFFGELMELSGGTFAVTLKDLASSGEWVYALQRARGERNGKVLDRDAVDIFHISDGVVTEVEEFFKDTGESDGFWA